MEQYKLLLYPTAKQDFLEMIGYFNTLPPIAALNRYNQLTEEIAKLSCPSTADLPAQDTALSARGYRYLKADRCLVFYSVTQDIVKIKRILYGKASLFQRNSPS